MRGLWKTGAGILLIWVLSGMFCLSLSAADIQEEETEAWMDRLDFDRINEELEELFPDRPPDFKEILQGILSGELSLTADLLKELVAGQLTYAYASCRESLIHILFLAVMAAIFHHFGRLFQSRQIAETSFYILYLLLIALCLSAFGTVVEWIAGGIESLVSFMGVFCPVYFLAVTIAGGSVTATTFYHLVLFVIFLVELFIVKILLPLIHICMMIKILNFLSEEDYLSKFAGLIEMTVSWTLRTLLAFVAGLNIMQSLISPVVDMVKRSVVTKGVEAIPVIGDALGGTAEIALGAALLVKNGIGMTGAVICCALCVYPMVQTGCIVLLYKLAAAVLQPVSDKRIVSCIESVSDGCRLLMKVLFTTGLLFLFTIVLVSAASKKG